MEFRASVKMVLARVAAPAVFVMLAVTIAQAGDTRLAYLSKSDKNQQPATDITSFPPSSDVNAYDGRWIFTGAGCRGAGSVSAIIKDGKVVVRGGGGNVTPDGVIHTVGAGNGLTLTAEGRLSGDSGSGTYDRSDGCSGTWIGVKQGRRR
jgi:hypothetical protein